VKYRRTFRAPIRRLVTPQPRSCILTIMGESTF
jgi:hypothetical protein